mgnify:FL=1
MLPNHVDDNVQQSETKEIDDVDNQNSEEGTSSGQSRDNKQDSEDENTVVAKGSIEN